MSDATALLNARYIALRTAEAKGLTLDFIAEGDPPSHVALDPDRLRQVLFNLIGNAMK